MNKAIFGALVALAVLVAVPAHSQNRVDSGAKHTTTTPAASTQPTTTAGTQPQWQCVEGQKINIHAANRGPAITHDFVHIHDTSDARSWMALKDQAGKLVPIGDRSVQTFQTLHRVETGKEKRDLKRYMGGGTLTYTVYYAETDRIPDKIWYLSRFDKCMGSVPVRKFVHQGRQAWSFILPIVEGGAHPLFERRVLQNNKQALQLCIKSSVRIYTPTLTAGPAQGELDTICSLPGTTPGTTRVDEAARDPGTTWIMSILVMNES